jgi:hypothetical protein
VPLFLCGGDEDPLVPYANTTSTAAYFRAQNATGLQLTVLNVDTLAAGPSLTSRTEFAAAKEALRALTKQQTGSAAAADQAVKDAYHAGLVAPFCLREARAFLDSAPSR